MALRPLLTGTTTSLCCVVLDMDGVLADTEPLFEQATRTYLQRTGGSVDEAFHATTLGRRTADVVADLSKLLNRPTSDVVTGRQRALEELIGTRLQPLPGVVANVERLRAVGLRLAVASSSTRALVEHVLRTLGLAGHFEVIASGDEVRNGKPAPDVYTLALHRLSVIPSRAVAVEDSPAGISAAVAAGLRVITNRPLESDPSPGPYDARAVVPDLRAAVDLVLSGRPSDI
jgi:HAD superfamily hydrolase (TIGR01509 family)